MNMKFPKPWTNIREFEEFRDVGPYGEPASVSSFSSGSEMGVMSGSLLDQQAEEFL